MEKVLLPLLRANNISYYSFRQVPQEASLWKSNANITAFRALAGGFLTGKFTNGQSEGTRFSDNHVLGKFFQSQYGDPKLQQVMKNFESALAPLGISGSEASLRWVFYHSALREQDAVILGASKLAQIKDSLRSISVGPLPDGIVQAINSIWDVLEESRAQI